MARGKKTKQRSTARRLKPEALEPRRVLSANAVSTGAEYWVGHEQVPASNTGAVSYLQLSDFESFSVEVADLRSILDAAPLEFTAAASEPLTFEIPTPDGGSETFAVVESPIMEPALAAQFPGIKTYAGESLDNPGSVVRFDVTPQGFHAQVRTVDGSGGYYVDPFYHLENEVHVSYARAAAIPRNLPFNEQLFDADGELLYSEVVNAAEGHTHDHDHGDFDSSLYHSHDDGSIHLNSDHDHRHDASNPDEPCSCPACLGSGEFTTEDASCIAEIDVEIDTPNGPDSDGPQFETISRTGAELRIYRTAVAATGEYTQFHGGTVAGGQAAIVTMMNRVNGVYEDELTTRMVLVGNNSDLVFTNPNSDPFPNDVSLGAIQNAIDSEIGFNNYDLGHLVDTGGGGFASLGSIGTSRKAQGYTGLNPPVNDPFWIDFVAHEMGHQYGGNHTFNGDSGACAGGQRAGSSAFEPGSGSTIMAYAGICGNDNLQNNSDPHFHSRSLDEIINLLDGPRSNVGTRIDTGNSIPTADAGPNFSIPPNTPFILTGAGSDADGDTLTYNWEQRDLGPRTDVNAADNGSSPLFRAWEPNTDPTRTLPRLQNLLLNNTVRGETMPTTDRILDFRLTVRDNNVNGGGVATDDMRVFVETGADPFRVTVPNTNVEWEQGRTETVTWDVAGTDGNGINTSSVNILLSLDGGNTYPVTLASATANDGSHDIVVPNELTTQARIKVEAVGNIFFDISNSNFRIVVPADSEAPTAVATAADITAEGVGSNVVTVVYTDNDLLDASTTGVEDIEFVAPDGTVTAALFLATSSTVNTPEITVTYLYIAPGGPFDADDIGTHEIRMVAGEITDVNQNAVAAGVIGSFDVDFATQIDGDFNDDGVYDCNDVNMLTTVVADGTNDSQFDLNDDGVVNGDDTTAWLAEAGAANLATGNSYLVGDANLDGFVDGSDFNIWNQNKFTTSSHWCGANFNGDAVIDGSDFNAWNANKFTAADVMAPIQQDEQIAEGSVASGSPVAATSDLFEQSRNVVTPTVAAPPAVYSPVTDFVASSLRDDAGETKEAHAIDSVFAEIAEWI